MREHLPARRVGAAAVLAALVAFALLWPLLAPAALHGSDYTAAHLAPSVTHPLGTDSVGRDLSLVVAGALRASLTIALGSALLATVLGVLVGATAAVSGPRTDATLMRATDAVAAVPHLLATLVVVALFRGSLTAVVAALALTHWPTVARIVRAEGRRVVAAPYVAASRAAGAGPLALARHHVLPAVAGQAALALVLMIPHAVWHESTLSFLGIGRPPEDPSLGTLVALSRPGLLLGYWWPLVVPTAVLVAVTVAVTLLGSRRPALPRARALPWARAAVVGGAAERPAADGAMADAPVTDALVVDALTVDVGSGADRVRAVDGASVRVPAGSVVAVVGPSGAGKSTLLAACCGLLPAGAAVSGDLRHGPRGRAAHVPQDAAGAFTPTRRVREQVEESLRTARARGAQPESVDGLCRRVGLDPALADRYPHQVSGGQVRRLAIALALSTGPGVLVADEPTSGLDADAARAVLDLVRDLADRSGVAVLLATHDVSVLHASDAADRVLELRAGRLADLRPTS
ncbi:ATP-binding cassette domain-containing protein [Dietzia aurantiaca]|uniref:ATP-binding cassette domain-containing protein n=1 Tax=Dietzia aurantiaca TaxID=983873 RepID=A0ABV9PT14_9ACTN